MILTTTTANKWIGKMVKIAPQGRKGKCCHLMPALLLEVTKKRARIMPRGHGHSEWVLLRHVHTWLTGNQICHRGSIN